MTVAKFVRSVLMVFDSLTRVLNWIGYISLAGIVLVTSADVIGRYCFNRPLLGALEILELSMAVLGGFAILYTTTQRGHISVDLFYIMFPRRMKAVVDGFASFLGFATWGLIAYEVYRLGVRSLASSNETSLLHIPIAPFQFVLALGLALYCLALLMQSFQSFLAKEPDKTDGGLSI